MKIIIEHTSPDGTKKKRIFEDKSSISIGRDAKNDVIFNGPEDRTVSSRHARIVVSSGRALIEDNHSVNGVYVDDRKVSAVELGAHARVRLGEFGPGFEVSIEGLEPASASTTMPMPQVEKRQYGERTVGMMIKQALAQAGLIKAGTSKSTDYFEALMDDKILASRLWMRWVAIGVAALVIAGGVGIGVYVYYNRSVQVVQNYGEAAGSTIAATNRYAVFLMAGRGSAGGGYEGFCTAFAIGENVLATNAHCVRVAGERYQAISVVMNGAGTNWYPVVRMTAHPQYRDDRISPDVGILVINGKLTHFVTRAAPSELAALGPGVPVFLYGFPGRLNRVEAPEATFISGQVGRVTGFDQRVDNVGTNPLIQHSAFSSQGTSGSPIFNANGRVVGINTGGYTEDGQILPGYNFAMRIDLLDILLSGQAR